MTSNTKKGILLTLCALIIAAAGTLVYLKVQKSSEVISGSDNPNDESVIQPEAGTDTAATPDKKGTQAKPLTYDQAIALYGKDYRFQISNCSSTPGKLNIKAGVKFMIDNRDKAAHTFKIGTLTYKVSGYGFAVATAPAKVGSYFLTCDGGGSAEITVYP